MRDPTHELKCAMEGGKSYTHLEHILRANSIFRGDLEDFNIRKLTKSEVNMLVANGNTCLPGTTFSDHVYTTMRSGEALETSSIRNCSFGGSRIVLGLFSLGQTVQINGNCRFPCGLFNSTFIDCVLLDNCLVRDCSLLSNCLVDNFAVVFGCGRITFRGSGDNGLALCGNLQKLPIGVETGGRDTYIFAEQTIEDAAIIAGDRHEVEMIAEYEKLVKVYSNHASLVCNVISRHANVLQCPALENVYIGAYSIVDSANVHNSTILSANDKEQTLVSGGAFVENSILQWGVHLESLCVVTGSLMCSHSHADRHGKVIDSIIGPFTGISEGEVTSSLLGPFVGFHHQSLVIATYWPAGRGNIGYGANVGSNHTGKLPDQELWAGEGTFFGLTTAIKFPSNFTRAPYSLIATGVTTLPQRVEMPFSLINESGETITGISPAFNEISPGWTLGSNLFMVLRNETKFKKRSAAFSDRLKYEHEIITRPDIINLMISARLRLLEAGGSATTKSSKGELIYTSKDVVGLGKNYMTETSRKRAIDVYTTFIKLYALRTLLFAFQEGLKPSQAFKSGVKESLDASSFSSALNLTSTLLNPQPEVIESDTNENKHIKRWFLHAQYLYKEEISRDTSVAAVKASLLMLDQMNHKIAKDVRISKEKDDVRGPKIIDGYENAHTRAENNTVVKAVQEDSNNMSRIIRRLTSSL